MLWCELVNMRTACLAKNEQHLFLWAKPFSQFASSISPLGAQSTWLETSSSVKNAWPWYVFGLQLPFFYRNIDGTAINCRIREQLLPTNTCCELAWKRLKKGAHHWRALFKRRRRYTALDVYTPENVLLDGFCVPLPVVALLYQKKRQGCGRALVKAYPNDKF